GSSPPAVDRRSAPSLDDVEAFCRTHPDDDSAPPLLPVPPATEMPDWCDEAHAYAALVADCGTPRVVVVSAGADVDADGSAAKPYPSITAALADCHGACHVLVGTGTYLESPEMSRCTIVEGGLHVDDGVVTAGAPRPLVDGTIRATGTPILLARLDIEDDYGALSVDGDVVVSDAVLQGGYEGGSAGFS